MDIDIQTIVLAVLIPIAGYFFKKFDRLHDEHDKRMDSQERHAANHFATNDSLQCAKMEIMREIDRSNRIIGELHERKADKELVSEMTKRPASD